MEEILKEDEYVRTIQGIKRISSIYKEPNLHIVYTEDGGCFEWYFDEGKWQSDYIVNHSMHIIDLIEVGDFVNGHRVIKVNKETCEITTESDNLINIVLKIWDIRTILIEEQYVKQCYMMR